MKYFNKRGSMEVYKMLQGLKKNEILRYSKQTCEHGHSLITHPQCLKKLLGKEDKIGFLDIETSNLVATYGFMFSYCIKELNGKILTGVINRKEMMDGNFDKRLVGELITDMKKFDRLITFYGARFDIPFIRTRALKYKLDFPVYQEIKHTDIYFMVRNKCRLHSNKLAVACDFFDIKAKEHPLKPNIWFKAATGDKKALDYIVTHNKEDVISTEKLWKKIVSYSMVNNRSL